MKFRELLEPKKRIYIARKLLNGEDIIAWAKENGLTYCLKPEDFHTTIFYTKNAIDWYDVERQNDTVVCNTDGTDRHITLLGKTALCLVFKNEILDNRHFQLRHDGLISTYNDHILHVTLSYREYDQPLNIMTVPVYSGPLIFGPEYVDNPDEDNVEFEEMCLDESETQDCELGPYYQSDEELEAQGVKKL
jgi:hypothetical protein